MLKGLFSRMGKHRRLLTPPSEFSLLNKERRSSDILYEGKIQHKDQIITRYYNPISRIDDKGFVDFMIKTLKKDTQDESLLNMPTLMQNLKDNDTARIEGPFTNIVYEGSGRFQLRRDRDHLEQRTARNIGILCENTGITAFFQIIEAIATSDDPIHVSIVFINKTLEDLVLLEELAWYHEENKIKLTNLIEQAPDYCPTLRGSINKQIVLDYMPPPGDDTLLLVCGSSTFKEKCLDIFHDLSYKPEMYWPLIRK